MIPAGRRCRPQHVSCSTAHAQLVEDYHGERDRQDLVIENLTNGFAGDLAELRARGVTRALFRDFLIANRRPAEIAA